MTYLNEQGATARIARLCLAGDEHTSAYEYGEALSSYLEAWELLPEPRERSVAHDRILFGVGRVLAARPDLSGVARRLLARSAMAEVLLQGLDERP